MRAARVVARLRTNLPTQTIFSAFEDGVGGAQDTLSETIIAEHPMLTPPATAVGSDPQLLFLVGLLVTDDGQTTAARALIEQILQEAALFEGDVYVLLVVIPAEPTSASTVFAGLLPGGVPIRAEDLTVDCVPDTKTFSKITEYALVRVVRRLFPVEAADLARAELEEAAMQGGPQAASSRYVRVVRSIR